MYKYGILFVGREDKREKGLILIADNGMLLFRSQVIRRDDIVYGEILDRFKLEVWSGKGLMERYRADLLSTLPDEVLETEITLASWVLNRHKFMLQGHRVKAMPVALIRSAAKNKIPYHEFKYKNTIDWFENFSSSPLFGRIRFKTVYKNFDNFFNVPLEVIDPVGYDEFARIEADRIPLFLGVSIAGVNPRPYSIPNFFNGNKLLGIVGRGIGGHIGGMTLYFIPEDIQREDNSNIWGFVRLAYF